MLPTQEMPERTCDTSVIYCAHFFEGLLCLLHAIWPDPVYWAPLGVGKREVCGHGQVFAGICRDMLGFSSAASLLGQSLCNGIMICLLSAIHRNVLFVQPMERTWMECG